MLTKTVISITSKKFFGWLLRQEMKLRLKLHRLVLKAAVTRAFQKFVLAHPRWAASLFDEYFLTGKAEPLLVRYLQTTMVPTAEELAAVWADQLGPLAPALYSPRRIEVKLIAAEFLQYLEAELQNYQVFDLPKPQAV